MAPTAGKRTVTPGWAWAVAGLCVLLLAPLVSQRGKLMPRATPLRAASRTAPSAANDHSAPPSGLNVANGTHHRIARLDAGAASSAPALSVAGPTVNSSRLLHDQHVSVANAAKVPLVAIDHPAGLGSAAALSHRAGVVRVAWPGPLTSAKPGARARSRPTVGPPDRPSASQAAENPPAPAFVADRPVDLGPARRVRYRAPRLFWGSPVNTGRGPRTPDPEQGQNG
jgi:hypothetical protein